ncbi:MAG: hypothetical protein ACRCUA_06760, partial [Fusobacteriaceae bacterium]
NKLQFKDILIENKNPFRVFIIDSFLPSIGLIASSNFLVLRKKNFTNRDDENNKICPDLVFLFLKSKMVNKIFQSYTENKLVINQDELGEIEFLDISIEQQNELISRYKTISLRKKEALELKKKIELQFSDDNKRLQKEINKLMI